MSGTLDQAIEQAERFSEIFTDWLSQAHEAAVKAVDAIEPLVDWLYREELNYPRPEDEEWEIFQ